MSKFKMTEEWLFDNYGSKFSGQEIQTREWLLTYGKNVPEDKLEKWSKFKHLSEYQVNTEDIVEQCLDACNDKKRKFASELTAHFFVNSLRVPVASRAYVAALVDLSSKGKIKAKEISSILELGVGGDSAISTSVFLWWLESRKNPRMVSVDRNPLGMTLHRYKKVPYWAFVQSDSLDYLYKCIQEGTRFDLVFIDTIHSYEHTLKEMNLASQITDRMLMDDTTFEGNDFDALPGGVKRAVEEWSEENKEEWAITYLGNDTVAYLERKKKK